MWRKMKISNKNYPNNIIFRLLLNKILLHIEIYHWKKISTNNQTIIKNNHSQPKNEKKLYKALTVILTLLIIIAAASIVYAIITPKTGEKFTELYILGQEGYATNYPKNLSVGEESTVIIGIVNHEYKTINYTIEVWLINQTTVFNEMAEDIKTIYESAWFIDKISVTLNHKPIDIDGIWESQWEYYYNFNLNKTGNHLMLAFLLFTKPTETYSDNINYNDIIEEKLNRAYRQTHLFINIV
jgi:uncharacterized membrane protein